MTRRTSKLALAVAATLGPLAVGSAHATPQPYTDFDLFKDDLLAAGLSPVRHGFDDAVSGTDIDGAEVDGITFSNFSLFQDYTPIVSDNFTSGNTRSTPNGIGADNPIHPVKFTNGDSFTISFDSTLAVGVWFLTQFPEDAVYADDFVVTVNGTPAGNGEDVPDQNKFNGGATPLGDGGVDGYFVGFIDSVPFGEAVISSYVDASLAPEGSFQFRVDDIYTAQAPVPTTFALLALGAGLFGFQRRRLDAL